MYHWFSQLPVIFGGIITVFTNCFRNFETQFAFGSAAWFQLVDLNENVSILLQRYYRSCRQISLLDEASSQGTN